jgi:DMSO/TMAO reductase YedYZ heme-binding membrane subunit
MVAVFVSSLLRSHLKPDTWRAIHWLAYASWPVALIHTFGMGTDSREHWVIALGALCVLSVGLSLAWRMRATAKQRAMVPTVTSHVVPLNRHVTTARTRGGRYDA